MLVVIVVVGFAKHKDVDREQVHRGVLQFEVDVAVFVCEPIDDTAMKRPHNGYEGQQQVGPWGACKKDEEKDVQTYPQPPRCSAIGKTVERGPFRDILGELAFYCYTLMKNILVEAAGAPHHREDVGRK